MNMNMNLYFNFNLNLYLIWVRSWWAPFLVPFFRPLCPPSPHLLFRSSTLPVGFVFCSAFLPSLIFLATSPQFIVPFLYPLFGLHFCICFLLSFGPLFHLFSPLFFSNFFGVFVGPIWVSKRAITRAGPKKVVRNEPWISKMVPNIEENLEWCRTDVSTVKVNDKFRPSKKKKGETQNKTICPSLFTL